MALAQQLGQNLTMKISEQILIVEDDKSIRELTAKLLVSHGFRVATASNGREMDRELKSRHINLIILDVMLPHESGDKICQRLRQNSTIPIIMLTSKSEENDKVTAFELGADDYITKPFSPPELLARIRAVLRRYSFKPPQPLALTHEKVVFSNWQLNTSQRLLIDQQGVQVVLTSAEYDLLLVFCSNARQVLSRDKILDLTQHRIAGPFERSVDILVSRLRQKLEAEPDNPQLIKTIRGSGYVFTSQIS
jgi:two-component system, OmpR family, response regulator